MFDRYRSGTFWVTARNAGHYTTNTTEKGRGARDRTWDTRLQRPMLYQLSYTPTKKDVRTQITRTDTGAHGRIRTLQIVRVEAGCLSYRPRGQLLVGQARLELASLAGSSRLRRGRLPVAPLSEIWCPLRDSNTELPASKAGASSNCAKRALLVGKARLELARDKV